MHLQSNYNYDVFWFLTESVFWYSALKVVPPITPYCAAGGPCPCCRGYWLTAADSRVGYRHSIQSSTVQHNTALSGVSRAQSTKSHWDNEQAHWAVDSKKAAADYPFPGDRRPAPKSLLLHCTAGSKLSSWTWQLLWLWRSVFFFKTTTSPTHTAISTVF